MIGLLCFVLTVLASPFKSKIRLEAENATLRHQLVVLRRKLKGRAHLTNSDRWFFVQLYRWFPSILPVLMIDRVGKEPWEVRNGCAPCKGGAFQWVQAPPGNRSCRKQSEQSWR
jgi:hypothetical protein